MERHLDTNRWCKGTMPDTSGIKPERHRSLPANTCEVCGKHLGNRRAYAGHMLLAHGKRVGIMAELDEKIAEMSRVRDAVYALALWVKPEYADDIARLLNGKAELNLEFKQKLNGHKKKS